MFLRVDDNLGLLLLFFCVLVYIIVVVWFFVIVFVDGVEEYKILNGVNNNFE